MKAFPPEVTAYLPLIIVHITGGAIAILTGYAAVTVKKGERLHRLFGTLFVISMLIMASMATYLAVQLRGQLPGQMANVAAGAFAIYLVATAWVTVRRKEGTTGLFEKFAMIAITAVAATFLIWGVQAATSPTGALDGYPSPFYFVFGGIGLLLALLDFRVIRKGGLTGAPRIARHLWRMCFGFFFAAGSFFIGQQKVMPEWMRGEWYIYALGLAPVAFMVFWLIRVHFTRWYERGTTPTPAKP